MQRTNDSREKMEDREAEQDPDPRHVKNARDQERRKKQEQDVTEGNKKKRRREHHGQAQEKRRGFAGFFARERTDGLEISAK